MIEQWVAAFNEANLDRLMEFYADNAINHQVVQLPIIGKAAIREMFEKEFATATMVCIIEQILTDGEWVILEWKDPLGLMGCGFFHIRDNKIILQRGYWDKLSFLKQHGMPIETE